MRKSLGTTLSLVLISTAVLAACSNSENASGGDPGDGTAPVRLKGIVNKHALTKPVAEMEWLQEVEAAAGVKIEWQEISADWEQMKGTMLASGDVPDLFVGPNIITDADFAQFQGLFQDLNELMELAPNVQRMFDEKPETLSIATQRDGQIYGLPKYQRYWPDSSTRQYINQQWLDNLGLDVPTTWDELYEVLLAFKNEDANGNGDPNDEIPMDWPGGIGGYFNPAVMLGGMGMTISAEVSGQGYFVEDGQVKNFLIDERFKELVGFLNKLYAAGLINPEVFTSDYTKYQALGRGTGDTAKIGFTWGWVASDRFGEQVAPQYTSMPPLQATPGTEVSWSYDAFNLNYGANHIVMSATSKNKEAAMRFINELYDPKVGIQVLFGSIGPNIEDHGDGTYSILPPKDEQMDPGTWKWTSSWADHGAFYISDDMELALGKDMQEVLTQSEPLADALADVDPMRDIYPGLFIKYSTQDNNTLSLNNTNIMNLAETSFAKWVINGGIEAEWERFITEMSRAGLERSLEIMQQYYDEHLQEQ